MSVFVTGDLHANPMRLGIKYFGEQKQFSENKDENIMIILGDFGFIWNREEENEQEKYYLDWLECKHFTTVFVDGNHENHVRLASYPVKEWKNGKVHEVRPHVLHLMRGEVFYIDGKKFFAFGGARSHDIRDGILDYDDFEWREKAKSLEKQGRGMYRVKGLSWWEEELPTEKEMQHGLDILKKHHNAVDFLITHSPSSSELRWIDRKGLYKPDVFTDYLEKVKSMISYKKHLFGHMKHGKRKTRKY